MRLASFNVENLFLRAKALNLDTWAEGRPILEAFASLNELIEEPVYSDEMKARMLKLLAELGLAKSDEGPFAVLRQNRGQFVKRRAIGGAQIAALGRADWIGWVELKTEVINETATRVTAQVLRDVNADVVGVCEVESRAALLQLATRLIPAVGAEPYTQSMLIDGNDARGIDVGIMARKGFEIGWMKSHVDLAATTGERVFSRDCPEYSIWTPAGGTLWVLVNHFKSKGYGKQERSDAKRHLQAECVRRITERLKAEGAEHVAVIGDFNDFPESAPLEPLIKNSGYRDIATHPKFQGDGHSGTYGHGGEKEKIDYILLSPVLWEKTTGGGVWRRGVWGPNKKPAWDVFPEMTKASDSGSDHAALWADFEV